MENIMMLVSEKMAPDVPSRTCATVKLRCSCLSHKREPAQTWWHLLQSALHVWRSSELFKNVKRYRMRGFSITRIVIPSRWMMDIIHAPGSRRPTQRMVSLPTPWFR
jgi:hypothetical protein